ncbi:MAG: hypothetical protein QI223_09585 [Candidatus Korarchaeota archaeon]|nr:hypothetical protein [Candidatus Korarchaeota archaeon]
MGGGKVRASVYLDREVWEAFKAAARRRGIGASRLLEEILREEVVTGLEGTLLDLASEVDYEVDFEPVRPSAPVSPLVRDMRDARAGGVPG